MTSSWSRCRSRPSPTCLGCGQDIRVAGAGMRSPSALGASKQSLEDAANFLAKRDPVIARLVERVGPPLLPRPVDSHFAALVRSVTYQQLARAAARAIHGRLINALDGEVTPERILATPYDQLRAAGLSGSKVLSLQDLSAKVVDGTVVLDSRRLARESDEKVIAN